MKVLLPLATSTTGVAVPLRRSPFTNVTVYVSATFCAAALVALSGPILLKGTGTDLPPAITVSPLSTVVKRNWKVSASLPLPVLSMLISYSALGSMV